MTTIKEKYGFVPTSVLHFGKTQALTRGFLGNQELRKSNADNSSSSSMSEFNPDLCKFIIECWSNEGDYVVDPYHGWGTRAVISKQLRRNYTGYDISPKVNTDVKKMLAINKEQSKWFQTEDTIKTELICGDGVRLENEIEGSADLIFSCPPYFNIEKYEDVVGQLSSLNDYKEFIDFMQRAANRQYEVIKDDKYVVMVVGDWRVGGELLMFSKDMIDVYLSAGFIMHDYIIHKLNSAAIVGCGNFDEKQFVTKSHEYVLVFKKVRGRTTVNIKDKQVESSAKLTDKEQWIKQNYGYIKEDIANKLWEHHVLTNRGVDEKC